jgi:hypothetical protein
MQKHGNGPVAEESETRIFRPPAALQLDTDAVDDFEVRFGDGQDYQKNALCCCFW